jgi:hypothetical protein
MFQTILTLIITTLLGTRSTASASPSNPQLPYDAKTLAATLGIKLPLPPTPDAGKYDDGDNDEFNRQPSAAITPAGNLMSLLPKSPMSRTAKRLWSRADTDLLTIKDCQTKGEKKTWDNTDIIVM